MDTEFRLLTTKVIFRFDEADIADLEIYCQSFDDTYIDDIREIFLPFDGEDGTYFNPDFGVDELRIRKWRWTYDKGTFELLDINSWPGDNEHGIIAIKIVNTWIPIASNSDRNLDYINRSYPDFLSRLEFFSLIRQIENIYPPDDKKLEALLNTYLDSEVGKQAVIMEDMAHNMYREAYDAVVTAHNRLAEQYQHEFTTFKTETDLDYLESIGYEWDKPTVKYFKIQWHFEGSTYPLIRIDERYTEYIYLIHNGLIKIMEDFHRVVTQTTDPLLVALNARSCTLNKLKSSKNLVPEAGFVTPTIKSISGMNQQSSIISNKLLPIIPMIHSKTPSAIPLVSSKPSPVVSIKPSLVIPSKLSPVIPVVFNNPVIQIVSNKPVIPNKLIIPGVSESTPAPSTDLTNMVVVFSGFRDAELGAKITTRGGRVTTSVSGKTTILVVKDISDPSVVTGKIVDARKYNIPIISKDDFIKHYFTLHVTKSAKR
jgi:hypothetical protein